MTEFLDTGSSDSPVRLVLAHGAGGAMTSSLLETGAERLAARSIVGSCFDFGCMADRRTGGQRRRPPGAELLVPQHRSAVEEVRQGLPNDRKPLIGGKSMGGR